MLKKALWKHYTSCPYDLCTYSRSSEVILCNFVRNIPKCKSSSLLLMLSNQTHMEWAGWQQPWKTLVLIDKHHDVKTGTCVMFDQSAVADVDVSGKMNQI